jgi:hypothetical protein
MHAGDTHQTTSKQTTSPSTQTLARQSCSKKASKLTRTSHHDQKAYEPSRQRLSQTKKRRPNTFTANAQKKKAEEQEPSSKNDINKVLVRLKKHAIS